VWCCTELEAVAKDYHFPESGGAVGEVRGRAPKVAGAPETAAQTYAVLRARGGFDISQLVAEYRALRASVVRLWIDAAPLDQTGLEAPHLGPIGSLAPCITVIF
jgi:hypothetical protein